MNSGVDAKRVFYNISCDVSMNLDEHKSQTEKLFSASSVCNTGMDGERAWWVHCCQAKDIELICRTHMVDGEKQLLQSIM